MTTLTTELAADTNTDFSPAKPMHPNTVQRVRATRLGFSLDWWSVIAAVALAAMVWTGVLPAIGW